MKKSTLLFLFALIYSLSASAQCLTAPNGQFPTGAAYIFSNCNSVYEHVIAAEGWAGEYSLVRVNIGETYQFISSNSTDYITISDESGTTALAFGTTPVTWTSVSTVDIRFYTHKDQTCGDETVPRSRKAICGPALLSNEDFNFQDFKFYPNPAENKIVVRAKEIIDVVSIYNLIGQEVIIVHPFALTDEIDVSGLTKGTYFMNVNINGVSENFKLLKE